jgi:hypothetical protein
VSITRANSRFLALNMAGKPFHSILEPFYEVIVQSRRAHMTWQEIADKIGDKEQYGDRAVTCTRQAIQYYFKRRRDKRIRPPMGMEPEPATSPTQPIAHPALAQPAAEVHGRKETPTNDAQRAAIESGRARVKQTSEPRPKTEWDDFEPDDTKPLGHS